MTTPVCSAPPRVACRGPREGDLSSSLKSQGRGERVLCDPRCGQGATRPGHNGKDSLPEREPGSPARKPGRGWGHCGCGAERTRDPRPGPAPASLQPGARSRLCRALERPARGSGPRAAPRARSVAVTLPRAPRGPARFPKPGSRRSTGHPRPAGGPVVLTTRTPPRAGPAPPRRPGPARLGPAPGPPPPAPPRTVGPPRRRSASPSGGIAARGAGWEVFDLAAPRRPALYGLGIEARELESGPKHLRGGLRLGFPETTACPFLAQEASGSARRGPLLVTALRTPGFWSLLSPELGMVALEQKGQATGTPAGPRRGPDQRLPAGSALAPEWWRRLLGVALPRAPGTQHQELGSAGVSQLRGGGGTPPPTMGASQCVHGGVCADGGVQR